MDILFSIISLLIALTIHEFAHAYAADKFGDPTPRAHGRVSLNPLRHLDPLGTLVMFFPPHFGWGKPVPIDPYNLSKKEETIVGLAGPISNLILAILLSVIIRIFPFDLIFYIIRINLVLCIFNLLPVPPLDGSKLFLNLLPESQAVEWEQVLDRYGFLILAALLFLPVGGSNIINLIITPVINFFLRLLLGV
jgi:Zn-dependent protease